MIKKNTKAWVSYEEIYSLPCLQNTYLLNSVQTENLYIFWAHCAELNGCLSFLHSKELPVLSINNNDLELLKLFFKNAEKQQAIGVMLLYSGALPESFIGVLEGIAKGVSIPVLLAQSDADCVEVCQSICQRIFQRSMTHFKRTDLMNRFLTESHTDNSGLLNAFKLSGYEERAVYTCIAITATDKSNYGTGHNKAKGVFESIFSEAEQYGFSFFIHLARNDRAFCIVSDYNEGQVVVATLFRDLVRKHNHADDYFLSCGIGPRWSDFKDSFKSMEFAEKLARLPHRNPVKDYYNQIIFRLLLNLDNENELYAIYYRLFAPILEYDRQHETDLMKCLRVYLDNDQNLRTSANHLYLHINTVRNRISKIEELLSVSLRESRWHIFRYTLGFYIEDYLRSNSGILSNPPAQEVVWTDEWTNSWQENEFPYR